ncbi:MAG: glycosyl hydrolase [Clostridiales bacterium]|nr:glycosyl hydrolase [Clostridiales bacterium]
MKKVDETRIEELLGQLTLEEKIGMLHGDGLFQTGEVKRLGIPPLKMSDGPMGVRKEFRRSEWIAAGTTDDYVTYLPSNSALAATWNRDLAYETGKVLGEEARGRGKDVILAPGINIKRSPLNGRNFEYMSEDPRLVEEMVVPLIKGIQEYDVAACVKHFVANNQETERLWVDTQVDERTLREIYFPGFKASVEEAEIHTIMGAYNLFRGVHCCHSNYLLKEILRDEWGFDGVAVSDWGGVHDTKEVAESGLDIEMSVTPDFDEYYMANPLLKAIKAGQISQEHIDKKIKNILRTMLRLNMLGEDRKGRKTGTYNTTEHRETVLTAARESVVLLKNKENILPLNKSELKKVAVIGQNAEKIHSNGGGSAEIKALYEISPLMGLKSILGGNIEINYAKGYYVPSIEEQKKLNWQQHSLERKKVLTEAEKEEALIKKKKVEEESRKQGKILLDEAITLAKESDEVIVIGGLNHDYDVEGRDRQDMLLPYDQNTLISEILKVNPNAVIVIVAGSPVEMSTWSATAKAIVWSWYGGMEGGKALAEVLLGDVNPSGKLPETFPMKLEDSPAQRYGEFGNKKLVSYIEGLNVGYRYFDTQNIDPDFCFGHGLSYTEFQYSELGVKSEEKSYDDDILVNINVKVKNAGKVDGAEVVQIYVSHKNPSVWCPSHELKGFEKIFVKAGEEKMVNITLSKNSFGYYDSDKKSFKVEPGEYEIQAASSSRDIRLNKSIIINKVYLYN